MWIGRVLTQMGVVRRRDRKVRPSRIVLLESLQVMHLPLFRGLPQPSDSRDMQFLRTVIETDYQTHLANIDIFSQEAIYIFEHPASEDNTGLGHWL